MPRKHGLQDYPWQIFTMDCAEGSQPCGHGRHPEVNKLRPTTSSGVIDAVKAVFSRHGIPETVRCDNGTQFSSDIYLDNASSLLNTLDLLSELPLIDVTVPPG